MREDAPQHDHELRAMSNGLRWIVRKGAQWRMMPNDLPPWYTVDQQAQRWINSECMVILCRAGLDRQIGRRGRNQVDAQSGIQAKTPLMRFGG
jgi:transposase